jgi:arsenate reductase
LLHQSGYERKEEIGMGQDLHTSAAVTAVLAALVVCGCASAQTSKADVAPATVVFVCEHGSAKSVVAAAHFNRLAAEAHLPFRAVSRGTKPDPEIAVGVKAGLAADGIDVSGWRPKLVSDEDIRSATQVVSLATELPATKPFAKPKLLEWNDIPPISADYDRARQAILQRVETLIKSLSAKATR